MNLLDLKRKAAGHTLRWNDGGAESTGTGDGHDGGVGDSGNQSSDPSDNSGSYSYSAESIAAAMAQMDAQAAENDANNPGTGWSGSDNSFSDAAAAKANALADAINTANPNKSAVDSMDALMGVSAGFGTMSTDNRSINAGFESGWSLGVADRMGDLGYGDREGLNVNNPTQSIAEINASRFTNDRIMPAVTGLITAAVPGAGLAMSGMRAAGSVTSGQKSLGNALKDFAIDYGSSKLAGAINSKVAGVVGPENMAGLGLISSASKAIGGPGMPNIGASVVSGALNVAGISKSTGPGFTSQNNPAADNGFTAPGTEYGGGNSGGDNLGGTGMPSITTPSTPTPENLLGSGLDMNLWGSIDGAGWKAAKSNYINNKRN